VSGNVVGVVGAKVFTDIEFLEQIQKIEAEFPRKFATHPQKMSLLGEMMNVELLAGEALRLQMDQSFEFKARLADLYVKKISAEARAKITDKEVEDFYAQNRNGIDQVSAKHILFKDGGRKAELEKLRDDLVKEPGNFSKVAELKSDDASKSNGGELGFFNRSMMVKPFSDAAFSLKSVGDISPVVESQFGYHIIQLSGDRRELSFSKDMIRAELLRRSQETRLSAELERLKTSTKFQIFEKPLLELSPLPAIVNEEPSKIMKWNLEEKTGK